eukprot:CAMPEP_0197300624 /NCGR_PEP_ID=MMETSP0890-20130614/48806_1 /TAXON_ID=44058 ORGANISM="Aureoumbra lagunensis, Strain CCMP1510" /NCGR_SAMPLE_ID=MMETSP0890 /ASSEMBLY_ACC=CAM_ASM_000533 /LENGTH=220 /DNA_ID=CAMNT_0042779573 /DNA_START=19 /DNA_END=681 /DNA_ORIENTATION=+
MSFVIDPIYPGTAVERMKSAQARVATLSPEQLSGDWSQVRKLLLWAGGLKDLENARPGQGYTGHAFNDHNHCDLTCMLGDVQDESNSDGKVAEISRYNLLGPGIRIASIEELGPGGSWSTCMNGCAYNPPQDVAHVQFKSRIAFKLVWSPRDDFKSFVLVDDDGNLLNYGTPLPPLPNYSYRQMNYNMVAGSKYARAADTFGDDRTVFNNSSSTPINQAE